MQIEAPMRFVCTLAGAFVLFSSNASMAQTSAPLTPLRIIASPVDDVMPVLYAQKTGMFRAAGLDVTINSVQSGAAAAAAVTGGAADIGKGDIISIILAHAHGVPLVAVAPADLYDSAKKSPDAALVVATGSPIKSAKDLVGKTIGVTSLANLSTLAIQSWISDNGGDWHALKFIELPYPSLLPALEQDRIQTTVLLIPFLNDAVTDGKATIIAPVYNAIAPRFLPSLWFSTRDYVANHPAVIAAFQQVVARAAVYTNSHPADTLPLLISFTGIDPTQATKLPRMIVGLTLVAAQIQPVIDAAAKFGLIPQRFNAKEIMP